jgi:hypothetical protein
VRIAGVARRETKKWVGAVLALRQFERATAELVAARGDADFVDESTLEATLSVRRVVFRKRAEELFAE